MESVGSNTCTCLPRGVKVSQDTHTDPPWRGDFICYAQRVSAVGTDELGHIEVEVPVATPVEPGLAPVDEDGSLVIHGLEIEHDSAPLLGPVVRDSKLPRQHAVRHVVILNP